LKKKKKITENVYQNREIDFQNKKNTFGKRFPKYVFWNIFLKKVFQKSILHSEKYFSKVIFEFWRTFSKTISCL